VKSKILIVLLTVSNLGYSADDPKEIFDTNANLVEKTSITWRTVDDVQTECEKESRSRGYGGFGFSIQACSFFDKTTCTIITSKKTTMHTIGHEVRHCFQGNWHK
jgi:hypothetical protein